MIDPPNASSESYYTVETKYSCTLNPPDNYQMFGNVDRFAHFYKFVSKHLLQLGARYHFIIELSEPRGFKTAHKFTGPRLHLHGIVWFDDRTMLRRFLSTGYYSLTRWTATDFDTIKDMDTWKAYISKQHIVPKQYRIVKSKFTQKLE